MQNKRFTFRANEEDLRFIDELARLTQRKRSDAIRFAIKRVVFENRFPLDKVIKEVKNDQQ